MPTQTIGVFQVFVVVLLLTVNGGPAHSTRTIVYGMYETAFTPMYDVFPNNALGDGVDGNDVPYLDVFPYLASPHPGLDAAGPVIR